MVDGGAVSSSRGSDILFREFIQGRALDLDEMRILAGALLDGELPAARIAAVLTVFCGRLPTPSELGGFLDAMLARAVRVELGEGPCIDLCGTGGDGKDTFNISTATSFVVAACGVRVAKHGNYGASSRCGSSNVLEALSVPLVRDPATVRIALEYAGICFLHAPYFHPALGSIAPIRRDLGVRTLFNLLGPLANPARPTMQYVGVSDRRLLRLFSQTLADRGTTFCVVHAEDGYDEISLTGAYTTVTDSGWRTVLPHHEGFDRVDPVVLIGSGDPSDHAAVIEKIVAGEDRSSRSTVVVANATAALSLARPGVSREKCRQEVEESIQSGRARAVLERARSFSC
jgi:anthranilate phosphoribosyltransferase